MEVGLGFVGFMGWDVRRAERDFMGWRFGVGGVMMFVVVFVVVFAPECKRGEWRKRREGKGRGGRRREGEGGEGEGRKENRRGDERRGGQTREEKTRETSRICKKGCLRKTLEKTRKKNLTSHHKTSPHVRERATFCYISDRYYGIQTFHYYNIININNYNINISLFFLFHFPPTSFIHPFS